MINVAKDQVLKKNPGAPVLKIKNPGDQVLMIKIPGAPVTQAAEGDGRQPPGLLEGDKTYMYT